MADNADRGFAPKWVGAVCALLVMAAAPPGMVGDGIPRSLTSQPGDPGRGRALLLAQHVSTCLLCHAAPLPEQPFQGSIGPALDGVGARLTASQIRLRIVDAAAVNPGTVMPSFYTTAGLTRVGQPWQGRPVLDAAQIEDVVAYLVTLR